MKLTCNWQLHCNIITPTLHNKLEIKRHSSQ